MLRLSYANWIKLLIVFLGYGVAGWLLSAYDASWLIWLAVEAMICHLTWVGAGAIALSTVGIVTIMWSATLANAWFHGIPWIGASVWAIALAFSWLLGMVLMLNLALIAQSFNFAGFKKAQIFCLLLLVTNLGLRAGQLLHIKTF
ncbi:MAG: hypothetical protein KME16_08300 [Scytolyngbya sp. HA4215-MV1]|jgi:hypothetical protein|nr:hypothetical protein [Scytolyngbya sp. HA4215-MV1]